MFHQDTGLSYEEKLYVSVRPFLTANVAMHK